VLSVKLFHTEEFEDFTYVSEVDSDELLKEVRELGLQFNRWYKWLEAKFNGYRQAYTKEQE